MANPTAVVLSNNEMLLIAQVLQASAIAGVPAAASSTPEQQALALAEAEQALKARNLAIHSEQGQLRIAQDPLAMVATCAYPQASLIVYYAESSGTTRQFFGHVRDEWSVLHALLTPTQHELRRLPDATALVDALLAASNYTAQTATPANVLFQIDHTLLGQVRALADQRQLAAALIKLELASVPARAAGELMALLSRPYATTIFMALAHQGQQVLAREYTILHAGSEALLMVKADAEGHIYQIQSMLFAEFRNVLLESLGVA